jgi:hypothetical protein
MDRERSPHRVSLVATCETLAGLGLWPCFRVDACLTAPSMLALFVNPRYCDRGADTLSARPSRSSVLRIGVRPRSAAAARWWIPVKRFGRRWLLLVARSETGIKA